MKTTKPTKKLFTTLLIIVLILSIVANAVLFYLFYEERQLTNSLTDVYSQEYFTYNSLTVQGFEDKVASGEEFIVIVSRPNCSSCEAVYQDVIKYTDEENISNQIYYLNVVDLHKDAEAWTAFKELYGFYGTPTYARFNNSEVVSVAGWTPESGIGAAYIIDWLEQQSDFFTMA